MYTMFNLFVSPPPTPPLILACGQVGPKGLEFAKYSIDYHNIRNYLYVMRHMGVERAQQHIPPFARRIVDSYEKASGGGVSARLKLPKPPSPKSVPKP